VKTYRILTVALVAALLVGCGAAKFAEEKTLLTTVTKAMEALTGAIEKADAPEPVIAALGTFSDKIESFVPAMKKINDEHPEWETNPPDELKGTMEKFKSATEGFQGVLPKLLQMSNDHADNPQLQDAFRKFQSVVGGL